jgi:hypothetical protein
VDLVAAPRRARRDERRARTGEVRAPQRVPACVVKADAHLEPAPAADPRGNRVLRARENRDAATARVIRRSARRRPRHDPRPERIRTELRDGLASRHVCRRAEAVPARLHGFETRADRVRGGACLDGLRACRLRFRHCVIGGICAGGRAREACCEQDGSCGEPDPSACALATAAVGHCPCIGQSEPPPIPRPREGGSPIQVRASGRFRPAEPGSR